MGIVAILLSFPILNVGRCFYESAFTDIYIDQDARKVASLIPDEQRDSVYTYGIPSRWYIETDLFPANKYCDWQDHYIELNPNIQHELSAALTQTPPKWIVTHDPDSPLVPDFLKAILSDGYMLYDSSTHYKLWRHNG